MVVHRETARVLPVSPDGAVLLLRELDPAAPGEPYWSSIGGGIDAGESPLEAAVRELREETGVVVDAATLVGPVRHDERSWSWNGIDHRGRHTWFALPLGRDVQVSFDLLRTDEVDTVLDAAWWTPDALADGEATRPPDLAEIMRAAISAVAAKGEQAR